MQIDLDASGTPGPGMLKGAVRSLGSPSECHETQHVDASGHQFSGQLCRVIHHTLRFIEFNPLDLVVSSLLTRHVINKHDLLYWIVLHCIVLYCIVLYCVVLYCIVLCCVVLYCVVIYCIVS